MAWLNNGRGLYEDDLDAVEQGCAYPDELGLATWSLVELIEAAVRSVGTNKAAAAITSSARRRRRARVTIGITARCGPLPKVGVNGSQTGEPTQADAQRRWGPDHRPTPFRNIACMAETEASGQHVDQFIVDAGYGEVTHRFQTFELPLCQFLARGIERGSSVAQVMENNIKWDNTTAAAIVRGLKSQVSPTFTRTRE